MGWPNADGPRSDAEVETIGIEGDARKVYRKLESEEELLLLKGR